MSPFDPPPLPAKTLRKLIGILLSVGSFNTTLQRENFVEMAGLLELWNDLPIETKPVDFVQALIRESRRSGSLSSEGEPAFYMLLSHVEEQLEGQPEAKAFIVELRQSTASPSTHVETMRPKLQLDSIGYTHGLKNNDSGHPTLRNNDKRDTKVDHKNLNTLDTPDKRENSTINYKSAILFAVIWLVAISITILASDLLNYLIEDRNRVQEHLNSRSEYCLEFYPNTLNQCYYEWDLLDISTKNLSSYNDAIFLLSLIIAVIVILLLLSLGSTAKRILGRRNSTNAS